MQTVSCFISHAMGPMDLFMRVGMCKVSVIIPVYNIEKFLPECIESLIKQNLESSEFIFINDGSTDSSGKILEQYIKKINE